MEDLPKWWFTSNCAVFSKQYSLQWNDLFVEGAWNNYATMSKHENSKYQVKVFQHFWYQRK